MPNPAPAAPETVSSPEDEPVPPDFSPPGEGFSYGEPPDGGEVDEGPSETELAAAEKGAKARVLAAGGDLPKLSYFTGVVPAPAEDADKVPPPPPAGDVEAEAALVERAKFAAEKLRREQRQKAQQSLLTEVPACGIATLLLLAVLTRAGALPVLSVVGIVRFLRPPLVVIKMLGRSGWLRWESAWALPILGAAAAAAMYALVMGNSKGRQITCRIGKMIFDRNTFCRGWLVTGGTGCGKTACAIMLLFHQLFRNEKGKRAEPAPKGVIPADEPVNEEGEAKQKAKHARYVEALRIFEAKKKQALHRGEKVTQRPPLAVPAPLPRENPDEVRYVEYPWGGVCIDEKGLFYQRLEKLCTHYNRRHDLLLLKTRPDGQSESWIPPMRFNLLSGDHVPSNTYAKIVVQTAQQAEGVSGGSGNQFFVSSAQINIGWGIELCRAIMMREMEIHKKDRKDCYAPSLTRIYELLSSQTFFNKVLTARGVFKKPEKGSSKEKAPSGNATALNIPGPLLRGITQPRKEWTPALRRLSSALDHFDNRYWNLPKETFGGVQATITTYLSYFSNPDVAAVFCEDNTFELEQIDQGKIICIAMPQALKVERQYVGTLLKLLFYTHVLRRFDRSEESFKNKNLLVIWQDEAQRFVTESDGNVDVIREAGATTVMACQSKMSLYAPLGGKEKATVTILNLRNRFIFQAPDEDCATGSADFLGKKRHNKKSWSNGKGGRTTSYSPEIVYKIEPFELRELPKMTAVVCHADGAWKKMLIEPQDEQGRLPPWYLPDRPWGKRLSGLFKQLATGQNF